MSETKNNTHPPIESYALIGDCETAALVGLDGSIDWLCWPDFSSDACFARLLGTEDNGRWLLTPAVAVEKTTRKYRDHTLILETTFESADFAVMLIDFMPIRGVNSDVVRIVKGIRGAAPMKMELIIRYNYGITIPWVTSTDQELHAIAGPDLIVLRTKVPLAGKDFTTVSEFTVNAGESIDFVMTYGPSHLHVPRAINVDKAHQDTQAFWENWVAQGNYRGEYRSAVERSLITLKALTYRPTGGIVAAATTSLPEQLGGSRNWDYRYCWLRDATFTLQALMSGGYYQEARAWQHWLLRAIAGNPDQAQIMYGIAGQRYLPERELNWLSGYEGSRPVRVGNAASEQLQLDIFGEVMSTFHHALARLGKDGDLSFSMLRGLMGHLETIWQQPDEGIWETRGGAQNFTYSKLMAWVAFDRAIKVAGVLHANAPVEEWQKVRAKIHDEICSHAYNQRLNAFMQSYGSEHLDAALLLMPMSGFLPPEDSRVQGTLKAIEKYLMVDGFVMRYDTEKSSDGLPPGEGVFLACSFWMVSALKLQGRDNDARKLFERIVSLANDVGLLSEEYDTRAKRLVGNFPQALSHIALVNAAVHLAEPSAR
ncbi:MAG TPA: glycoside hydrolase family 15 protein [Acidobacteriaceae bacterium]|nr:glycoside hydrolase family 15 protein [Acidobacteriaceae bacterium]